MGSLLDRICDVPNNVPLLLSNLTKSKEEVILYGAGYSCREALRLLRQYQIPVAAICDDFRIGQTIEGRPIISIKDAPIKAHTVIFITCGLNSKMKETLVALNIINHYVEIDFGRYDGEKENKAYYLSHRNEIERAYTLLADEKSKHVFEQLLNYRISRDLTYLKELMEESPQYFPSEILPSGSEKWTFLDIGAFDGDTIKAFLNYSQGEYKNIIAVEASKQNYELLCKHTTGMKNISCFNIGILDQPGEIKFVMDGANNSFISANGSQVVKVTSIDHLLNHQPVDCIKMDIEGVEFEALIGARNTIQKNVPILMVCVYHKVEDIYRLQLLIEDYCPGKYFYYLRHYSPTVIETVLYAIPKK